MTRRTKRPITAADRDEVAKFETYLRRRAERPDEPQFVTYGEVYGEVVFEDRSEGEVKS